MNVFEAIEKCDELRSKISSIRRAIEVFKNDSAKNNDIKNMREMEQVYFKEFKELEERMKATKIESFTTLKSDNIVGRPTTY